jgi:hypothetical protein
LTELHNRSSRAVVFPATIAEGDPSLVALADNKP